MGRDQLGSRHAQEAYKITWQALPITNGICEISDKLHLSKKIKTKVSVEGLFDITIYKDAVKNLGR